MLGNNSASGATRLLDQSAAAVPHTGDILEATLATITVPSGAMGANGKVEIKYRVSLTGTTGIKTIRVKFGGTTLTTQADTSALTSSAGNIEVSNRNATNSQHVEAFFWTNSGAVGCVPSTAAVDTAAAVTILITGQLGAAADTVTLDSYQVILTPKG